MKSKKSILIILLLLSHFSFAQSPKKSKTNLSNTYWKVVMHYVNADTWTFIPLTKKPEPNAKFDFLTFDNKNGFQFYMDVSKVCTVNLIGSYTIEKSQIHFNETSIKVDKGCQGLNDFRLDSKSMVIKEKNLYLTQPTEWYNEEPKKNGDTILMKIEQLGRIETNKEGKNYATDANTIPLDDATYKYTSEKEKTFSISFTVRNRVLDGTSTHQIKDLKNETFYKDGKKLGEKRWMNQNLTYENTNSESVVKDKNDYIITLTEIKKNLNRNQQDSIVTVFRNTKPILKTRFENNKLVTNKDFEENAFWKYERNGKLVALENSDMKVKYDYDGKEQSKQLFKKNGYELYKYGILREKKTYTGGNIIIVTYDEKGNTLETKTEKDDNIMATEIADIDKYTSKLSSEEFNYYKTLAK